MTADLADKEPLDIARDVVEHTDYLVSIDTQLNGDERIVAKLARALLVMRAENERMQAVLVQVVECFDGGTLSVEHNEIERDTPKSTRIGNVDSGDAWFDPVCGDDHDACSRETCPAIWVVNEAARIIGRQTP